jgi:glyoxylase-like metal-dependent hydrolase (beta-lactamase superfamily II)
MRKAICLVAGLFMLDTSRADDGPFTFQFEELANGVWAGVREDGPRFPVMGNTVFVIGEDGVVVFDGGGMPAMSEQLIAKIRSLTDKPVTHVVISHWHGDHSFGVYRFAEEYPGVQFVAHAFTRDVINSTRINYIDRGPGYIDRNREEFERIVATGRDSDGAEQSATERAIYARILEDGDAIEDEQRRARVTPPDIVFSDSYTIGSGSGRIELLYLGHGNTAGDIVMWLPGERIVATGDIVVLPSPYAYNVPPRPWAATLRAINALDYRVLVPGHGEIQQDTDYVDLLIEAADSIADQRDTLTAQGVEGEALEAALDFSAFEERFTHGDEYLRVHYEEWFVEPFRKAATKAMTGEPMVQPDPPVSIPFDDARWQIEASEHELVDYRGVPALKLRGGEAILPALDLKNAMLEFEIAFSLERGFVGAVFRQSDAGNYEHFYVRPHQSGNPDANQYQPVFNGSASWQLYYGPDYAVPVEYRHDEWTKVKIIYAGDQARVYIDSDEPVLRIGKLMHVNESGAIGVSAGNFAPAYFANFRYTQLANAYRFPPAPEEVPAPAGTVTKWQVSDAFDHALLDNVPELTAALTGGRDWAVLETPSSGIANLARVARLADGADTVFAKLNLESVEARTTALDFGFSDKAKVFVNGKLVYSGDNTYLSRDYRYLGTIGLFDSVMLQLDAGHNEIWIAVTEAFGGWGIEGRIADVDGITLSH